MQFEVLNEDKAQWYTTKTAHLAISIRSPKTEPIILPLSDSRIGTLFMSFHDVDERMGPRIKNIKDCQYCEGTGYLPKWKNIEGGRCFKCNSDGLDLTIFNKKDADTILLFVESLKQYSNLIIVNCEAGISRSAGVAAALSKIYNGHDSFFFKNFLPNMLVYRTILEEAETCEFLS